MSIEKSSHEAWRWLLTALDDLDSAKILRNNGKYPHACFHAQQAGEKALKSLWYFCDADPWGHSIVKLIDGFIHIDLDLFKGIEPLKKNGQILDRYYIPTRYPNGLPDVTPGEVYLDEDAAICIEHAEKITEKVKELLTKNR